MNSVDEPLGDPIPSEEERLWSAAARLIGDELPVSADDTQMAYGRLQAMIRGATDGVGLGSPQQDELRVRQSPRVIPQTLRRIATTVFGGVARSAMAALSGRKVTTLTAAELERLRSLVEQAEPEDE